MIIYVFISAAAKNRYSYTWSVWDQNKYIPVYSKIKSKTHHTSPAAIDPTRIVPVFGWIKPTLVSLSNSSYPPWFVYSA